MKPPFLSEGTDGAIAARPYRFSIAAEAGIPQPDAVGITEETIRAVVEEFYRRARLDDQLGPVFNAHIKEWDLHLKRMVDFWSAALLRTGRYSGNPVAVHRAIDGLSLDHFDRWIALFEITVRDLCPASQAEAFLGRARRMRDGMVKILV